METKVEFPAYNIYYRQGGTWMLHCEPVIGKTLKDVKNIATGILFGKKDTDAVRIYGIFNCQQTFISEINKGSLHTHGSDEYRLRKAIRAAIGICNEVRETSPTLCYGDGASVVLSQIRTILSNALATSINNGDTE